MRNFVVMSLKRSGSTFLISALNSHPEIICSGEIFKAINHLRIINPKYSFQNYRTKSISSRLKSTFNKSNATIAHLQNIYNQDPDKAFGFKLMPRQIKRFPASLKFIHDNKISSIFLFRENYLTRLVSMERAKKTGIYASTGKSKTTKLRLDTSRLIETLNNIDTETNLMKKYAMKNDHMILTYEDLMFNKPEQTKKELLNFIGVKQINLKSDLKKIITNHISESIENYDEVYNLINNSKFKYLLTNFE